MTPPSGHSSTERRLVYAVLLAASREDHQALNDLLCGLDLGERDTLTTQLAAIAAHFVPLEEEDLAAVCMAAAAQE